MTPDDDRPPSPATTSPASPATPRTSSTTYIPTTASCWASAAKSRTLTREDGKVVRFFLSNYYKAEDSTDGTDSQSATAYLEAGKNRCVLISVTNNLTEGRDRLSDEEMTDWVRRIAETITIEEPESK